MMANPTESWWWSHGIAPNKREITQSGPGRPVGGRGRQHGSIDPLVMPSDLPGGDRVEHAIQQRNEDIRLESPEHMEQLLASIESGVNKHIQNQQAGLPIIPARGTGTTVPTGSLVHRILSTLGILPDYAHSQELPAVSEPSLGVQRPHIDPTTQRSQYQPPEVANIDDPSGTGGRIRGREEMLDPNFLSSQTKGPIPNANLALQFLDRLLNDPERNLRQVIDQGASGLQPFMGQSGQNQDWLEEARLENLRKEIMNLSRGVTQATQERDAFSQGPVQFPQVHRPIRPTWSPN